MAKDSLFGCLIRPGIVQQCCDGMPAVMRGVIPDIASGHYRIPKGAEPCVRIRLAALRTEQPLTGQLHPSEDKRQYPAVYGNGANPRSRFAVRYAENAGAEIHVTLFQGQQFPTAHAGIEQNENGIRTRQI